MTVVGADTVGLETLVDSLARAADELATHRRAIGAAASAGVDLAGPARTLAVAEIWCRETVDEITRRLGMLRWYADGGSGGLPGRLDLPVTVERASAAVTVLSSLSSVTRGASHYVDDETLGALSDALRAQDSWLGPLGLTSDGVTIVDPPHDGARGTADRLVAGAQLVAEGLALSGAGEVAAPVAIGFGLYWLGGTLYDKRGEVVDEVEGAWDGLEPEAELLVEAEEDPIRAAEEFLDELTGLASGDDVAVPFIGAKVPGTGWLKRHLPLP